MLNFFGRAKPVPKPRRRLPLWATLCVSAGAGLAVAIANNRRRAPFSFADRVVVITGGSRGLGLVVARALAAEGARLALLARNPDELRSAESELNAAGAGVLTIRCDVRKQDQIDHAIQRVVGQRAQDDDLVEPVNLLRRQRLPHGLAYLVLDGRRERSARLDVRHLLAAGRRRQDQQRVAEVESHSPPSEFVYRRVGGAAKKSPAPADAT